MVDYALKLLSHGFVCVPLSRNGRHLDLETMGYAPLHLQTRQKRLKELCFASVAFQLAQQPPSAEMVQRWFGGFEGNVGIIGGYGNLMVLDFDSASAYQSWQAENRKLIAATPVAKSPNGFHVYFKTTQPTISSSLHFGFRRVGHIKALGGYVLSPPSKFEDGNSYRWLPGQKWSRKRLQACRAFPCVRFPRLRHFMTGS
ncbi:MAG TPA: bifunctional DNA primase/polymerase [Verrucomicrobiae bacterium]|nr:bifunctional DNA primase/polymerase [Verrucomicrobiae bacterium]